MPRFESKAAFCQKQVGILALPSTLISAILILVRKYFNKQKPHSFSSWFSEWIQRTEGGKLNLIRLTLNWIGILTNISHQASNKAVRLIWIESSYFLSLVRGSAAKGPIELFRIKLSRFLSWSVVGTCPWENRGSIVVTPRALSPLIVSPRMSFSCPSIVTLHMSS